MPTRTPHPAANGPRFELAPLFLKLAGRRVLLVGGGSVAAGKLEGLLRAGADVRVVAPEIRSQIAGSGVRLERRPFAPADLDGAWLAVAAATPEVNREVAREAERRCVFVNAVDDPASASAYAGGVVRRGEVAVAISTGGRAPALAGLLREGIDALLPDRVEGWVERAEALRARWKADAVPLGERRPGLLVALNELYGVKVPTPRRPGPRSAAGPAGGFVSLVGAGPGDPELLTVKAVRLLEEADLVLYDALVSGEALRHARRAHCFFVGKRAGRPSVRQETIHRILIQAARAGKRVVRLKAGDPFVFGRGGEEALALAEAGVPHEVVPGLSSALAAPALAGIPLTHRGLAAGFTVVSGHSEEAYRPLVAALPPGRATLVVLMGLGTRARLAEVLQEAGWPPSTPAAAALGAATPAARTWVGTLAELAGAPLDGPAPGTLVVGEVAALARPAAAPRAIAR
ncbi:MAG TPA: uroporphyrinogen-III C-methyltransferase [Anaeromyxobacter sp.]|nr:uroporphyrinogen-III C-methyltransferase [Anaeromyxobacter sp.]